INFIGFFAARNTDLIGIDDDHMIACIQEWRVAWFRLAHQQHSCFTGKLAQNQLLGVNYVPLPHDAILGGELGTHLTHVSNSSVTKHLAYGFWGFIVKSSD